MNILQLQLLKYLLIGAGLSVTVVLVYHVGFISGKRLLETERAATTSRMRIALTEANNDALLQERRLLTRIDELNFKRNKERENAESTENKLRTDVATGSLRLSVATRRHDSYRTKQGTIAEAISGPSSETRAELTIEAADALITIVSDGDKAIRQLNGCIDAYSTVVSQ